MDSDGEVEVTGAQGFDALRAAPHSRSDCITHRFDTSDHAAYCPQCYCFVCDIPSGGCTEWASHCHATPNAPRWVALRAQAARRRQGEEIAVQRQGQRRRTATADRREDVQRFVNQHVQDPEQEEEEHEEVFAPYKPRYFNHGAEHPDSCVETTSLSFVEPPCPRLPASGAAPAQLPHILATATRRNTLSSLQLEAVMYADSRHSLDLPDGARAGFFLGDGPGVGKGRQMAALILENWLAGRKRHVWFSVSPDLYHDARRDLDDLLAAHGMDKADLPVYSLSSLSYRDIDAGKAAKRAGVIFCTYSSLVAHENERAAEKDKQAAALERNEEAFASAAASTKRSRLQQLVAWMRAGGGDGCVIFDESHKAKNLLSGRQGGKKAGAAAAAAAAGGGGKGGGGGGDDGGSSWGGKGGSKTAQAVMSLQEQLPKARVVYCSATGASSVRNMAYMTRLGLWGTGTQFASFNDFDKAIERSGYGGMELVALDMKQRGCYLSRTLSYKDATFETVELELGEADRRMYNDCASFWQVLCLLWLYYAYYGYLLWLYYAHYGCILTMAWVATSPCSLQTMLECFTHAIEQLALLPGWKAPPHAMSQFWGAHQRFFKQMCMAIKVSAVVRIAQRARAEGKCVVIGLQTTGEARLAEAIADAGEEGLEDFRGLLAIIESLLERQFPTMGDADAEKGDEEDQLVPRPGAAAAQRHKLGGSSSGGGGGGEAAKPLEEDSSDDDFCGEAAAEQAALCEMQKTLRGWSDALLQLGLDALGVRKWKGGKERDARARRLHDEYKALWQMGKSQLRRRLADLGAQPHVLSADMVKRQLVDKLWRRSIRHQWRLLERSEALPEGLTRLPADAASDDDDDDGDGGGGGGGNGGGGGGGGGSGGSAGERDGEVGSQAREMLTTGRLSEIRAELLREARSLRLPDNPLDELIAALGGADKVAELTGRKMRLVYDRDGRAQAATMRTEHEAAPCARGCEP